MSVGRYNRVHKKMTAAESAVWVTENSAGAEVVIHQPIPAKAIAKITSVTQMLGWTRVPHGEDRSRCICSYCLPRGRKDFMRRVRAAYELAIDGLRQAQTEQDIVERLRDLETPFERASGRIEPDKIFPYCKSPSPKVRYWAASLLGYCPGAKVATVLQGMTQDPDETVRNQAEDSIDSLLRGHNYKRRREAKLEFEASRMEFLARRAAQGGE